MGEKKGMLHEEKRALAWKLLRELLAAIPGEKEFHTVEAIIDEMKSIAYYNAEVKIEV